MIDALSDMKPLFTAYADALFRQFEDSYARFVASGLLGGDYLVEGYSEFGCSGSEQVVVHVGDHCELVAALEFAQGFDRVRKWLPVRQRFR